MKSITLLFLFILSTSVSGKIIYVNTNILGGNLDGTSWPNAIFDLQQAIDMAEAGDSIWVAAGNYIPTFLNDRNASFEIKNGVKLFASFGGTETDISQRNFALNPTILNGDIGVPGDSTDNLFTIMHIGTTDTTTIIDGFIFKNGNANNNAELDNFHLQNSGAAIYISAKNSYAYPVVRNCIFINNSSVNYGGAVYVNGRNGSVAPSFISCTFENNFAGLGGGACRKDGSSWIEVEKDFYKCNFINNSTDKIGGAVFITEEERTDNTDFIDCLFHKNSSIQVGACIFMNTGNLTGSEINVWSCTFTENHGDDGTVLFLTSHLFFEFDKISLRDCLIKDNSAEQYIIYIDAIGYLPGKSELINCSFINNIGNLFFQESFDYSSMEMKNVKIYNNYGDVIFNLYGFEFVKLEGCDIQNNTSATNRVYLMTNSAADYVEWVNSIIINNPLVRGSLLGKTFPNTESDKIIGCLLGNTHSSSVSFNQPFNKTCILSNSIILENEENSNMQTIFRTTIGAKNNLFLSPNCQSLPDYVNCGSGNIFGADPMFLDTAAGDYRLHPCSPARNSGSNDFVNLFGITNDINGKPRIVDNTVDMGPHEIPEFEVVLDAVTAVDCYGESTGSAMIDVESGCAPYTITFGGASTFTDTLPFTLDGLPSGTYDVIVNDSEGRTKNIKIPITSPSPITIDIASTGIDCSDGSPALLTTEITGGTPSLSGNYEIIWSGGTHGNEVHLAAGSYALQVTDSLGCTAVDSFLVEATGELTMTIDSTVDVSCYGGSDGLILVSTVGTAPLNWIWESGQTSQLINQLPAGNYSVTVTDSLGCAGTVNISLTMPDSLILSVDAPSFICHNEMDAIISINANGGTLPYSYLWQNGSTDSLLSVIGAGNYSLLLTDANGCTSENNFTVTENSPVIFDTLINHASGLSKYDGAIFIENIQGGIPPYSFLWSTGDTTNFIENIPSDNYSITITDSLGCENVFEIFIDIETNIFESDKKFHLDIYPNPVKKGEELFLLTNYLSTDIYTFRLIDALGKTIWQKSKFLDQNKSLSRFSAPTLSGIYYLLVENKNGEKIILDLIVQ